MKNKIYGFVKDNIFYSGRIKKNVLLYFQNGLSDGIYGIDLDHDDFMTTLSLADVTDAKNYFSKNNQFVMVRGISVNGKCIPHDLFSYANSCFKVFGNNSEDFDEILSVRYKDCFYFLEKLETCHEYALLDIKTLYKDMEERRDLNIHLNMPNLIPSMKMAFFIKKASLCAQIQKEMELEYKSKPEYFIRKIFEDCGAEVISVESRQTSIEVKWKYQGYSISSLVGSNFNVIEAGFCVSGYDDTQSTHSLIPLMKVYLENGDHIHKTRY